MSVCIIGRFTLVAAAVVVVMLGISFHFQDVVKAADGGVTSRSSDNREEGSAYCYVSHW